MKLIKFMTIILHYCLTFMFVLICLQVKEQVTNNVRFRSHKCKSQIPNFTLTFCLYV